MAHKISKEEAIRKYNKFHKSQEENKKGKRPRELVDGKKGAVCGCRNTSGLLKC